MSDFGNINSSETQMSQKGRCFMNIKEMEVSEVDNITKYKTLIVKNWNKSRDAIIKVGQLLNEAHEKLSNNKSWTKVVEEELPFSKRTADRLRAIANCEWITSGDYNDSLPVSWGTLYEISQMNKDQFEHGINNKKIDADSTRQGISNFIKNYNNKDSDSSSESSDKEKVFTLGNFVINKDKVMKDKKLDVDVLTQLKKDINEAVSKVSDVKVDFTSLNEKIKNIENKKLEETTTLAYNTLYDDVNNKIQTDPDFSDKYLLTPDGMEQLNKDFFSVKELSFLSNKYVATFGFNAWEKTLEDVGLPEAYYENLKQGAVAA